MDADDRLLPNALERGVECLKAHPECAFVSGRYTEIAADGSPLPTQDQPCPDKEHYLEMLRCPCYIGMPAVVMYQRSVFESVGGFDDSYRVCEDFDLYLRITRDFPVCSHGKVIAEYRQYDLSMSRNFVLMLKTLLGLLRSQRKHVKGSERYETAINRGISAAQDYYGGQLAHKVLTHARRREWTWAIQGLLVLVRYHPRVFVHAWRKLKPSRPRG